MKSNTSNILNRLNGINFHGHEDTLQRLIIDSLGVKPSDFFSTPRKNKGEYHFNDKLHVGIGREFGFKKFFIDIANLRSFKKKYGEPEWVCEIKVFNQKKSKSSGRYYPWIYSCYQYDEKFNFIKKHDKHGIFIMTNADEGQIFFDLIKMLKCNETCNKTSKLKIYQFISIKETDNDGCVISYDYALNSIKRIFDIFNINIYKLVVYDYSCQSRILLECDNQYDLKCNLINLKTIAGISPTAYGYHNIFLEWEFDKSGAVSSIDARM